MRRQTNTDKCRVSLSDIQDCLEISTKNLKNPSQNYFSKIWAYLHFKT